MQKGQDPTEHGQQDEEGQDPTEHGQQDEESQDPTEHGQQDKENWANFCLTSRLFPFCSWEVEC